jgi:hypothetical protein
MFCGPENKAGNMPSPIIVAIVAAVFATCIDRYGQALGSRKGYCAGLRRGGRLR